MTIKTEIDPESFQMTMGQRLANTKRDDKNYSLLMHNIQRDILLILANSEQFHQEQVDDAIGCIKNIYDKFFVRQVIQLAFAHSHLTKLDKRKVDEKLAVIFSQAEFQRGFLFDLEHAKYTLVPLIQDIAELDSDGGVNSLIALALTPK